MWENMARSRGSRDRAVQSDPLRTVERTKAVQSDRGTDGEASCNRRYKIRWRILINRSSKQWEQPPAAVPRPVIYPRVHHPSLARRAIPLVPPTRAADWGHSPGRFEPPCVTMRSPKQICHTLVGLLNPPQCHISHSGVLGWAGRTPEPMGTKSDPHHGVNERPSSTLQNSPSANRVARPKHPLSPVSSVALLSG